MSTVRIHTALGVIEVEVFEERAPASTTYFLADVRTHRYNDTSFFRIVTPDNEPAERQPRIATIQGGLSHRRDDPPPVIPHENTDLTGLRHLQGTVSLARFSPGAVYHSFFICVRDEPALDFGGTRNPDGQGFAAFGHVTAGFGVVRDIYTRAEARDVLEHPIRIHTVRVDPVERGSSEQKGLIPWADCRRRP